MNRRSFFARMLGAACLAVAERVLPAAAKPVAVVAEPGTFVVDDYDRFRGFTGPDGNCFASGTITVDEAVECVRRVREGLRRLDGPVRDRLLRGDWS